MTVEAGINPAHHEAAVTRARLTPHLHVPRLVRSFHLHDHVHGRSVAGRLNAGVAVWITKTVGTMYCAYIFAAIALVALPAAVAQGSATVLVNWLSSNFLQLVLLPVIMVGQKVISAAQDARAEADHETLTALHEMAHQQMEVLAGQKLILDALAKRT